MIGIGHHDVVDHSLAYLVKTLNKRHSFFKQGHSVTLIRVIANDIHSFIVGKGRFSCEYTDDIILYFRR